MLTERRICAHHRKLFFSQLLYFFAVLDLVDKDLGRFKTGYKVFVNDKCRVPGDVPGNFLFPFLVDKATEPADIDVIAV